MKEAILKRLSGLIETVVRFPLTAILLLAAAVLITLNIAGIDSLTRPILTAVIGALASAAAQSVYERFFSGHKWHAVLYSAALVVTALFYLSIYRVSDYSAELPLRMAVTAFCLWIAFIWLAVVKSRYSFGESFMASFKAVFQALFFSGIIFLGCVLIIAAISTLITPIDEDAYMYTANVAFVLIAPLLYFSLIPVFPGRGRLPAEGEDGEAQALIDRRTGCPRFLEVLLSYIIIPLIAIFTVVLLIYIAMNIGGSFWTDNLLEPMLISYSVAVIAAALLVEKLENRFAALFRLIFPKVLIPIALFQTVASVRLLVETGLTHGRYYVILFGFFAVVSGVVLSVLPARRNGFVAAVLILLSAVSLIPPVDAFSLSRTSQIRMMESVLAENGMLSGGQVTPNGNISDTDKETIIAAIGYLTDMAALDRVKWLPTGFMGYDYAQFNDVFGFNMYEFEQPDRVYISVWYEMKGIVPITGYDAFAEITFPYSYQTKAESRPAVVIGGRQYSLSPVGLPGAYALEVTDESGGLLQRFELSEVFSRYAEYPVSRALTLEEATFTAENDAAALKIVVKHAGHITNDHNKDKNAQLLVFIKIK